jgi:formiminoglutamase
MAADPRIKDLLGREVDGRTRVAILGFPSDEGVRRNGGRPGAAGGPAAIREALLRLTPGGDDDPALAGLLVHTVDLGDVAVSGDLEADQERLAERIETLSRQGILAIVLGGGHEAAYGHFRGHTRAGRDVAILNWDAHADVRPLSNGLGHSGSPFRQALEDEAGRCVRYDVAGLMPWRVAPEHAAYVRSAGGNTWWRGDLDERTVREIASAAGPPALASFDLDLVDAAAAPGVSAPGVGGLEPALWLLAARECGRNPRFLSFDIVEMNPAYDEAGRTATLAALTVWHILRGIAER